MTALSIGILASLLLCSLMMLLLWAWARRVNNYSIVDIAFAALFTPVAWLYAFTAPGWPPRKLLIALLVSAWSLRLASHLSDRILHNPQREDPRYAPLSKRWQQASLSWNFLLIFQGQGMLVALLSLPIALAAGRPEARLSVWDFLMLLIFAGALVGEHIADTQLKTFNRSAANKGKVCDRGLWAYSRHPNYFFEWLIWVALAAAAWPADNGAWGLAAPALMLFLLLRVTGLPPTEAQAVRSRGQAYRDYQKRVSAFFPWPPKGLK